MARNSRAVAKIASKCKCYESKAIHTDGTPGNPGAVVGYEANYECTCGYELKRMQQQEATRKHNAKRRAERKRKSLGQVESWTPNITASEPTPAKPKRRGIVEHLNPKPKGEALTAPAPITAMPTNEEIEELRFYQEIYPLYRNGKPIRNTKLSLLQGRARWEKEQNRKLEEARLKRQKEERRIVRQQEEYMRMEAQRGSFRTAWNSTTVNK